MRTKPLLALSLAAALGTSACATTNPYTGEQQRAKATTGATIGALAGAVIGVATGDDAAERRKCALIGAGVGAIGGGSVGYYMDVQEAKLRDRLQGTGVSVTRQGDNIVLNLPSNITFATDQAQVQPAFVDVLGSVALVLDEYDKTVIQVAGHTDATGSESYNQLLSERRADAVASVLAREGIDMNRIVTRGYGEQYPVASNDTEAGRAQNRRVELTLIPITQ